MSTNTLSPVKSSFRQAWIVSAWWDLTYVVITPVLIVPVVLLLARHLLSPEALSLAVIAFASLGHHLPGFMRAYGDRELFMRFRMRFLLVPPLVFGMALLFTPPASIKNALHFPWVHLHGLELILLLWGTWHGLMQIYGFMRIYDVRLGIHDRWSARLDHWLCLVVFVAGMVFSDARVFAVANTMWQSGLPLFGPQWVTYARWLVGIGALGVLIAYIINLLIRYRQGQPISWLKMLLIGITGWFYWFTGRLSTNVLIGLAMFEIFHAVQYYAIVWIYNRRLFQRAGDKFGMLGFLFRDRWSMLGIYLAIIAAYSSIRYFVMDSSGYVFLADHTDSYQWLMAFFVTSSILHFYFDGFIWQVSEKKTQQNLVEQCTTTAETEHKVPGWAHAAKLGLLIALVLTLVYLEQFHLSRNPQEKAKRIKALTSLTPDLPECQSILCRDALQRNDGKAALEHGLKAIAMRPRSHAVHADLGLSYLLAGKIEEARQCFEEAIALSPQNGSYHAEMSAIWSRLGENKRAEFEIRQAIEFQAELLYPRQMLVDFLMRQDRIKEAEEEFRLLGKKFPQSLAGEILQVSEYADRGEYQRATELAYFLSIGNPGNWRVQLLLGGVLTKSGDPEAAIEPLETALKLRPTSAEIYYQLGRTVLMSGRPEKSIHLLLNSIRIDPTHYKAQLQLAGTYYVLRKYELAIAVYERCRKLRPEEGSLYASLGAIYLVMGNQEKAKELYRAGIVVDPDSGQLNYNLGLLMHQLGSFEEARKLIARAQELGIKISAEVQEEYGL